MEEIFPNMLFLYGKYLLCENLGKMWLRGGGMKFGHVGDNSCWSRLPRMG
jgi:hypothetical protein